MWRTCFCFLPIAFCALFALTVVVPYSAHADSIVVPQSFTTVEGDSNNLNPFNMGYITQLGVRYQQEYDAAEFDVSSPIEITQIAFRPDAINGKAFSMSLASIQIDLCTTYLGHGLFSSFAANIGADDVTVFPKGPLTLSSSFTGPASGPKDFDIVINLTNSFVYDPTKGNLLLDVRNFSSEDYYTHSFGVGIFDFTQFYSDAIYREWSENVNSSTANLGYAEGLITRFTFTSVPEPSTLALLMLGAGGILVRRRNRKRSCAVLECSGSGTRVNGDRGFQSADSTLPNQAAGLPNQPAQTANLKPRGAF